MERVSLTWDVRNWITISLMALVLWFGIGAVMAFLRPGEEMPMQVEEA